MKEFIDKLIERLEEESSQALKDMVASKSNAGENFNSGMAGAFNKTIAIVNQLAEEYNDGWHPYSETNLPPAGYVREVWLTLEDGVFKAVWMRDRFEWENGFLVTETPLAWKFYNIPEPYQPKGE